LSRLYKSLLAGFVLLLLAGPLKAGFVFSNEIKLGFEAAVELNRAEVKKQLQREQQLRPDNAMSLLVEDYLEFYQLLFTSNPKAFAAAEKRFEQRLAALEKQADGTAWGLFAKGRFHLHRALLHGADKSYFTAASQLNKANSAIAELRKRHPDFLPGKRERALLDVVFGGVPDQYKWAASAIGWKGDQKQGLQVLRSMIGQLNGGPYAVLIPETRILLAYILGNAKEDYQTAWQLLAADPALSKTNLTALYLMGRMGPRVGKNEQAIQLISKRPVPPAYADLPLLEYYLATCYLYKTDPRALIHYEIFLATNETRKYRKDALVKMAYLYWLRNDEPMARKSLSRLPSMGANLDERDAQAEREAAEMLRKMPHKGLLQARFQYDGGYFEAAWETLSSIESSSLQGNDLLEFHYRQAQVLNDWGKEQQAIAPYRRAIELGKNDGNYFPANACYRLGMIYERQGQNEQAMALYKQCLKFDKHAYTQSLHNQAKSGIERLKS
jgi:tetratricopeptide (TPR) repeat protein